MATWKKVIVSGSSAALSALTLDTALPVAQGGTGATSAGAARTALGVDAAGADNSTAVTLANTNYLSLSGQQITGGTVPVGSGGTGATSAPMVGLITAADAGAARTALGVDAAGTDNSTAVTLGGSLDYITLSGQAITRNAIDLTADVTGVLPSANLDADTAHLSGTQTFSGAKTFSATLVAEGDVDLGNATSDTLSAIGRFDTNLVPSSDSARDLGTTSLYWANAYIDAVTTTGNINAGGMISGSFISSSRDIHIKGMAVSASVASLSAASGEANESSFKTISVSGQSDIVADADDDTLTVAAGAGLAITTTAGSDTITFANDGVLEDLDTLGAAGSDGQFIVATGAGAFAYESANTARTSLGLGTGDNVTHNNMTIDGDLTVNGSTTTLATQNLTVEDRFVFLATGSAAANVDSGLVVQVGANADTGSALYHDINSSRWAVAKTVKAEATAVTPLSFVTTITTDTVAPNSDSGSYGVGEMWVETDTQDIFIRTA
jgi:hypothetical protein